MGLIRTLLVLISVTVSWGQSYWDYVLRPEQLANPLDAELVHFSSWARNNGNSDLATYYGTDANGWQILCDIQGPGVITDFWWTKDGATSSWRWRLYVDDMNVALIDTPIVYPFGRMDPFRPPVADSSSNGYWNYCTIPFQSRVRITYNNVGGIYFHVTALKFAPGTQIGSFTMPPSAEYLVKLDSLKQRLLTPTVPIYTPLETRSENSGVLAVGETLRVFEEPLHGRTRRFLLKLNNRTQTVFENLWIRVYSDGYPLPDIEGPISVALGTPLGWRPYQSTITGSIGDTLYFNLPIVAGHGIKIELENRTGQPQPFSTALETVNDDPGIFRLNGVYTDANPTRLWENMLIAEFEGRGNFVGTVQDMQQPDAHVLEGDELFYINGETIPSWHGTGTEDYFKGGRYWSPVYSQDELHGCVAYLSDTAAAYRWHNNDPIPFVNGLRYETEIGRFNNFVGHYQTMVYAYVERPLWKVLDQSGSKSTHAGEALRIVGQKLDPEDMVIGVMLGDSLLELAPGSQLVVNADSIFDATFYAPETLPEGEYPLVVWTEHQVDTIKTWRHLGAPTLWFQAVRTDIDNAVTAGDTLTIELHGLRADEGAQVAIDNWPTTWLGAPPTADASGKLRGRVRVQSGLTAGDYVVTGIPDVSAVATADSLLHYRNWFRVEPETIYKTVYSGTRVKEEWCRDWLRPSNNDPWGRYAVHQLTGANASSYVTFRFYAPTSGTYQVAYFFGKTSNAPIVTMEINGEASLPQTDMFEATLYGSWERSDTLWGGIHTISEGLNTVTMRTVGKNPSSTGWKANFDQMLLFRTSLDPAPRSVEELTIQQEDTTVRLSWLPVLEDVEGTPISIEAYDIFRSQESDSLWHWEAAVPGNDTTWTFTLDGASLSQFMVSARRNSAAVLRVVSKAKVSRTELESKWDSGRVLFKGKQESPLR